LYDGSRISHYLISACIYTRNFTHSLYHYPETEEDIAQKIDTAMINLQKKGCRMGRTPFSYFSVIFIVCLLANFLCGCARLPVPARSPRIGEPGPLGECADFFASLDKQTQEANVIDPGAFQVKNYPYLRVNRFLASFGGEADNGAAFAVWADRMQSLDQEARKYEIANLPGSAAAARNKGSERSGLYAKVVTCGDRLKAADFQTIKHQEGLKKSVSVPDDYITSRRILGIYPLTSMFVYSGVSNWHAEVNKSFSSEAPVNWRSIRYSPEPEIDILSAHQPVAPIKRDALGIPIYPAETRKALLQLYAPVWEIQFEGNYDRIGAPLWTAKGVLGVDTEQPVTFTMLSFTRFEKEILTQLNYIIWFPSRPKNGTLDIYGGFLDGINYRVTLDDNHEPLLYETVHNCGCYYKAYPTNRLPVRVKIDYAEPPLILKAPEVDPAKNFMTVSITSRTHYVQHLYPSSYNKLQTSATLYALKEYDQLRSLPQATDDRRSIFSPEGIVKGSERSERFILWPTGVHSPGAMRQWGRQPVAFVGKRHFDDPFYMQRMFLKIDKQ
jgi:hypothetical protein